jgi:hypothetical protein
MAKPPESEPSVNGFDDALLAAMSGRGSVRQWSSFAILSSLRPCLGYQEFNLRSFVRPSQRSKIDNKVERLKSQ